MAFNRKEFEKWHKQMDAEEKKLSRQKASNAVKRATTATTAAATQTTKTIKKSRANRNDAVQRAVKTTTTTAKKSTPVVKEAVRQGKKSYEQNPYTAPESRQKKKAADRKHPHQMTNEARYSMREAATSNPFPQAEMGILDGYSSAKIGTKVFTKYGGSGGGFDQEKLRSSGAYKAGDVIGKMIGYASGYSAATKATGKAATLFANSGMGKRLVAKAAKQKVIKAAARRTLQKAGKKATEKALEQASKDVARKALESATKNAVSDLTVGTLMDSNTARAEGMKVGSDEWKDYMKDSAVANLALGGAFEAAPVLKNALLGSKGGKAVTNALKKSGERIADAEEKQAGKTIQRIVNGKPKYVKVSQDAYDRMMQAAHKATDHIKVDIPEPKRRVQAPTPRVIRRDLRTSYIKGTASPEMKQVYNEYIGSVDEELKQFIEETRAGQKRKKDVYDFSLVGEREAREVKALTGVDVSEYKHRMRAGDIEEHIDHRHGQNGAADRSMADANDIARVGYVLDNYDTVEIAVGKNGKVRTSNQYQNSDGSRGQTVVFKKRIDGKYYVAVAVPDSKRKAMNVISTYIERPKAIKKTGQVVDAATAPPLYARSAPDMNPSSNTGYHNTEQNARVNLKTSVDSTSPEMYNEAREGVNFDGREVQPPRAENLPNDTGRGTDLQPADEGVPGIRGHDRGRTAGPDGETRLGRSGERDQVPPVDERIRKKMNESGITDVKLQETSDYAVFSRALENAKQTNAYGGFVDSVDPANLPAGTRTFLSEDGTVGVAVKPDGNIVGVFKAGNSPHKKVTPELLVVARANGGTKMDCFGIRLVKEYEKGGYVPVARIPFDPSQVDDAVLRAEQPDVYVMMKNTDDLDTVIEKMGKGEYHISTQAELDSLPTFNDYDAALWYRDKLLDAQEVAQSEAKGTARTEARQAATDATQRDLGADIYKKSTKKANIERYGEMDGVPKATPYGETSQTARTIYNGNLLDKTAQRQLMREINDGMYAKYTRSNKVDLDNAVAEVEADLTSARETFNEAANGARTATSADIVRGYQLAKKYQELGDYSSMHEVLGDVANMESEAGRTLQAMRVFRLMTPQGRVLSTSKMIKQLRKKTHTKIEPPTELLDQLGRATDEDEIYRLQKEISKNIWDQIPASWSQKANAWRYISMLANPRTHVRNILGNAIFVPVKGLRNMIATGLEKAILRGGRERSKAVLTFGDRDLIKAGKADFQQVKEGIMNGTSRYEKLGARDMDAKVFNTRGLEWLRQKSGGALEKEDEIFLGYAYERAYAQYLKANGVRRIEDAGDDILKKAREYAEREGLNSTYRDACELSDQLSKLKRYANTPLDQIPANSRGGKVIKKLSSTALESTVPFTKTPINIMRRGWDYSPGGLGQGIVKLMRAGGDTIALREGIEKIASGITGTGIMMIGGFMAAHDLAQGALDTSSQEGKYASQNGEQGYSIRIGDYTYTMDWAAPISMPFFVGVELGTKLTEEGLSSASVLDAMAGITDPIFNLSMLSGLNNALDVMFSKNATAGVLGNIAEGYGGQFIPTAFGQIARTLSPTRLSSTSTAENSRQRDIEYFINSTKNKIPGLANTSEPYVDLWGEEERKTSTQDYLSAFVQNFLSPGTLKSTKLDSVDRELYDIGKKLGSTDGLVPTRARVTDYTQEFGDKSYHMSESDLTKYNKTRGQEAKKGLEALFKSKDYKDMSPSEKRTAIKNVYDEAKDKARNEFLISKGVKESDIIYESLSDSAKKAFKESGMSVQRFKKLNDAKRTVTKSDKTLGKAMRMINAGAGSYKEVNTMYTTSERAYENAQNLVYLGFTPEQVSRIATSVDTDGSGRCSTAELINYLETTDYSTTEKAYLFQALAAPKARNPYA